MRGRHRKRCSAIVLAIFACSRPPAAPTPGSAEEVAAVPVAPERARESDASGQESATAVRESDASGQESATSASAEGPPACRNGQRLDSGCVCRPGGACFDICCGPMQDCAHPHQPGGKSACLLRMPPPADPPPARECRDGELLADGCTCKGDVCKDICCVGSACSHGAGGWSKCVSLPKRGK